MRVLIDECAPKALKTALGKAGFNCQTVPEAGWSGKANGELLALADERFDVFVTLDQNLPHQQNFSGRKLSVVVIRARSNRLKDIEPHLPACIEALRSIQPRTVVRVG